MICALYVVAYAYILRNSHLPMNASGNPIVGDYIAFQAAGQVVLSGDSPHLYDRARIAGIEDELLQKQVPGFYDAYRNPPFVALVFAPVAAAGLLSGFLIWTLISLVCLGTAMWLLLEELPGLKPRWRGLVLFVAAFAPVYFGVIDGENASISLLLYVLIYRALMRDRDGLAGLWAALGLFKPQLFVVFPVVFLARRSWRGLLSFGVTAVCLAAVSVAMVGLDGMQAWVRILLEPEARNATANAWRMASLKSFFDALLPAQALPALGLTLVADLVMLACLVATWSQANVSRQRAWIVTSLVAVLVDPHLVDYDLTVLVPAGVLSALLVPQLRWWIGLLYPLVILRAQVPVGAMTLQLTVPVLAWCTYLVLKVLLQSARGQTLTLAAGARATDPAVLT